MSYWDFMVDESSIGKIRANVDAHWDLAEGPFPVPRFNITCPVCQGALRDGELQLRYYRFHRRDRSVSKYRCDVAMKCKLCSHAFTFGVVVPEEYWRAGCQLKGRAIDAMIHWREAKEIIDAQKAF